MRAFGEGAVVWRAFFMAVGLYTMLLGGECFILDRVELSKSFTSALANSETSSRPSVGTPISANIFQNSGYQYQPMPDANSTPRGRMFKPREWMPWSLLAAGAVIVMYTSSTARKTA